MLVINFEDVLFYISKNHFFFVLSDIIEESEGECNIILWLSHPPNSQLGRRVFSKN